MLFSESFLRKLERLSIMSRRTLSGHLQGQRRSPKRGQSVEFADFRPYTPGDDFRRIDWNAYARLERFFMKLFADEEDVTVHILLDASRSMDWGQPNKLEFALRVAGALGYITLAGLDRVTVTTLGATISTNSKPGYFAPHRGKQSANALFAFLKAHLPPAELNSIPIDSRLQSYAISAHQPGPLILISDFLDSAFAPPNINTLAANGFEVTLLHTLSPEERNPSLSGDLKLIDSESGIDVEITADYHILQRYQKNLVEWQTELRSFSTARGMHYVPVETTLPLEELLFAWMRQYSVLK
jgi:uncharacterized protein (DUF58 family)